MNIYLLFLVSLVLVIKGRHFQTATIIATNDIHGVALPITLVRSDNN